MYTSAELLQCTKFLWFYGISFNFSSFFFRICILFPDLFLQ